MDTLSQQKQNAKKEQLKKLNSDYVTKKSVNKFFEKYGYFGSILIVFGGLASCLALFTLMMLKSQYIHWSVIVLITLLGIGMYFYSVHLKKNNSILINETSEKIELSTPIYFDLLSIFGRFFIISGFVLICLFFKKNSFFFIIGTLSFFYAFILYLEFIKSLFFSLFDKIVIQKDFISIDDPESRESIKIDKNEISRIVDLKNKSGIREIRSIEFELTTNEYFKIVEINEDQIKNLRLPFDLFVDSMKKMGYDFTFEIQEAGKVNRTDENGNQILSI
jgi:hypothetical protein